MERSSPSARGEANFEADPIAEHDRELVGAAASRHLLTHQPAIDLARALRAVVVLALFTKRRQLARLTSPLAPPESEISNVDGWLAARRNCRARASRLVNADRGRLRRARLVSGPTAA